MASSCHNHSRVEAFNSLKSLATWLSNPHSWIFFPLSGSVAHSWVKTLFIHPFYMLRLIMCWHVKIISDMFLLVVVKIILNMILYLLSYFIFPVVFPSRNSENSHKRPWRSSAGKSFNHAQSGIFIADRSYGLTGQWVTGEYLVPLMREFILFTFNLWIHNEITCAVFIVHFYGVKPQASGYTTA